MSEETFEAPLNNETLYEIDRAIFEDLAEVFNTLAKDWEKFIGNF